MQIECNKEIRKVLYHFAQFVIVIKKLSKKISVNVCLLVLRFSITYLVSKLKHVSEYEPKSYCYVVIISYRLLSDFIYLFSDMSSYSHINS